MESFIAQLLWVAVGDYYEGMWPLDRDTFATLCAIQHDLSFLWEM
jgi:hypothetical protein